MRKSALSLQAYLALTRGGSGAASLGVSQPPPRPSGPLIWCHASVPQEADALAALAGRIRQEQDDATLLGTGLLDDAAVQRSGMLRSETGSDSANAAQQFAAHWRPDVVLWAGQALRPAVLHHTRDSATRMILLNAKDASYVTPAPRWMPDVATATLELFDDIFATTTRAQQRLRRMAIKMPRLHVDGALVDTALPLPCHPGDHEAMAATLSGRPVWLAAHLHQDETDEVLRAQRRAGRLAHRLLLVVVPGRGSDADLIARKVADADLRVADWDAGAEIEDSTQVVLARDPEELGLWYRVAPVSFIGGSLVPGVGGHTPFEGAALGSALLYGPNVGAFLPAYTRLAKAGAARIVRDADTLAAAVSQTMQPDRSATMAHAGWDVISQGAELTDKVLDMISETLDRGGA